MPDNPKEKRKKNPGGRPSFVPTDDERKMVSQMVAVGIPQEQIAQVVRDGINHVTLRKHFKEEIRTARIKANAKVGGMLFNKAMNGDTTAAIFWAKTQMGWTEKTIQDNTSSDGSMKAPMHIVLTAANVAKSKLDES